MADRRRRRLVVDRKFQYELLSSLLFVLAATSLACAGILWWVLHEYNAMGVALGLPPDHFFFETGAELATWAASSLLVTLAGMVSWVVYGGLVRSRRIAGPIVSLRRELERAVEGPPLAPLRIRKGDYFSELSESFNRLMSAQRARQ